MTEAACREQWRGEDAAPGLGSRSPPLRQCGGPWGRTPSHPPPSLLGEELLLRKKAAEELKKEQERKAAERRKIIDQRCGQPKNLDGANEAELEKLCRDFHSRIERLEGDKWDLEHQIKMKDYQVRDSLTPSLATAQPRRRRQAGCTPVRPDADCLPAGRL
ncbi:Troponin I [Portunus trituberculatus]|uniref:Troponin I n=1 Tax=Portunus trituberculatus TaxID=210409 RepID=A0A5B7DT25_PORTR|nr:Troponin I [Portunus trituberculatus]